MKIEPLADRVLVKRSQGAESLPSGLIIPESAREKPGEGEVVAVGPGRAHRAYFVDVSKIPPVDAAEVLASFHAAVAKNPPEPTPLAVKVGQRVLFGQYAGTPLEVDRIQYVLLREEEIIAIVHEPDATDITLTQHAAPPPRD